MQILDGRSARAHYTEILKDRVATLSFIPCLAIIQVGDREDSTAFIKSKKSFAKKIGVEELHIHLYNEISEKEVIENIKKLNKNNEVQGIIVQLPLPEALDAEKIIKTIDPKKDVDGLVSETTFTPATARGISELLDFYQISLKDKKVTVMGRSKLVGMPIALMCERRGATVTVCHKGSEDNEKKAKNAEILIVAIGDPEFVGKKYVSKGQTVIDVGITRLNGILVGDVDYEEVKDIVDAITPVPGGVGQMTVLALFENLVDSCYNSADVE